MSTISCQQRPFGNLATGETITCYSLRNTSGMTVTLLNYGATVHAVQIPDSRGKMHEITLGFPHLENYTKAHFHSGASLVHLPAHYGMQSTSLHQKLWKAE